MRKLKFPTYRAKALRKRIERDMPRCRKFVSEFWRVSEKWGKPKSIDVREEKNGSKMASTMGRKMIFWADSFDILPKRGHYCERPDQVLVHELAHIALRHLTDFVSKDAGLFLAEGLADFTAKQYYKTRPLSKKLLANQVALFREVLGWVADEIIREEQEPINPLDYKENKYLIGRLFIEALYEAGYSPKQMSDMLWETTPYWSEFFLPLQYLDRVGTPYEINPDSKEADVVEWIQEAVKLGLEHVGKMPDDDDETKMERMLGILKLTIIPPIYPLLAAENAKDTVVGHYRQLYGKKKGAPRHLLPNPRKYGSRFIAYLDKRLESREKVLEMLREYPPESFVGTPESIGHILEPNIYLNTFVAPWIRLKEQRKVA